MLSGNGVLLPAQWGRTDCYLQQFNQPNNPPNLINRKG